MRLKALVATNASRSLQRFADHPLKMEPSTMQTISKQTAEHYTWGGSGSGRSVTAGISSKRRSLSVIEELMPPGAKEVRHFHVRARQFFFVLEGGLHA